jgi:hypothetical protein
MNLTKESRRSRPGVCLAPDVLEDRLVMSAGQGSTFAIMPGSVAAAGQVSSLNFKIDPTAFTAPTKGHGSLVLGIDVAPASTSSTTPATLKPEIISVSGPTGRMVHVQHTRYDSKIAKAAKLGTTTTSAVLFTVKVPPEGAPAADYSVQVRGLAGTTGTYLVGFYLPGDIAGTGSVTKTDLQTIKKDRGLTSQSSKYIFDADVNRNGVINSQDLAIAKQDLGASTTISPVISVNLDPASNPAANRTVPYSTVHFAGKMTPGAKVTFLDQSSGSTTSVAADSTGAYSIIVPLVSGSNTFQVTTMDAFGQSISGAISPVVYSPSTTAPGSTTG